ncbi:MAG TPA: ATP-binding protein [Nevskiaceae bacterium]|nr:ATP-binding protein [Nevskiaceae bacterium]
MLQRLLLGLSVAAALAVLVVLIGRTQSEPQSLPAHLARVAAIQDLASANRALEDELARARLSFDSEPPSLAESLAAFDVTREALAKTAAGAPAVSADVAMAFVDVQAKSAERSKLVSDHRAQMRKFVADYRALRTSGEAVLADLSLSSNPETRRKVMSLLEELTRQAVASTVSDPGAVNSLLASLDVGVAARDAASGAKLTTFTQAARAFVASRNRVRGTYATFTGIPMTRTLDGLHTTYYAQYAQQEARLARYRLVLAVYASALLVVFGFFGWRLRSSYAELRVLNTGLEQKVTERTTELRKALDDLRLQQAHLIQSEKMAALGQMVAGVAHEINTPLGYARGNVETIREVVPRMQATFDALQALLAAAPEMTAEARARLDEALRGWDPAEGLVEAEVLLGDADHGLAQIGELVMSLKNFSRVDRSFDERLNVNEGIDSALKICQSQLKNRVTIERDFGDLPEIPCAPSQLNQVFLNLITNAAQAIDGDGTIGIATRATAENVEIAIRDTGCGMDAETLAHIYEPFFTTKDVGKGTGLGLSIVFRIIEDHHGRIAVESTPGKGTTFTITLPKQAPGRKASKTAAATEPAPALDDDGLLAGAVS